MRPRSEIDAAARFGRALGMAFQLVDDMLDYAGDKGVMGKNAGNDLKEGKMTLPLIYLMKNGNTEQKISVRKSIDDNDGSCFEGVLHAVQGQPAHWRIQHRQGATPLGRGTGFTV